MRHFILCYLICLLPPIIGQAIETDLSYILVDIIDQTLSQEIELNDTKILPSTIDKKIHVTSINK